jgi:predicted nucleotidyltransferase
MSPEWSLKPQRWEIDIMLNSNPTAFADLNAVIGELVAATQAILGDNFCGAYLQGSFAVGNADIYSDVDFVIATHAEVSDDQFVDYTLIYAETQS